MNDGVWNSALIAEVEKTLGFRVVLSPLDPRLADLIDPAGGVACAGVSAEAAEQSIRDALAQP